MGKFLDSTGVSYLMSLIKTYAGGAVTNSHTHSNITLSTSAQQYSSKGNTIQLPSSDPYSTARTPTSHTHGNISNTGTRTDTAAAAAGNDYVVIRDASDSKIQTSTIKGTDVADAVSKKHSHSSLTLSTSAQAYDGSHTLALPSSDPYSSARTPTSHTHGNIANNGTITSIAVTSASGVLVYDSSNVIQRAAASSVKSIIGLGNVTNDSQVKRSEMGAANGVATLGNDGKVPSSQLPSFVDDVVDLEGMWETQYVITPSAVDQHYYNTTTKKIYTSRYDPRTETYEWFGATEPSTSVIYVLIPNNKTYRWNESATEANRQMIEISPSPGTLDDIPEGQTNKHLTATLKSNYNAAYAHAVTNRGSDFPSGLYKITTNPEGHVIAATMVTKADITALGIPGSDTDTKNTAGTDDTSSKIFLIGATGQSAANTNGTGRTYTHDTAYVGTNGKLYSGSSLVIAEADALTNAELDTLWAAA